MTMSKKNKDLQQLVSLLSTQNAEQHAGLLDMGVRLAIYQAFAGPIPERNIEDVVKELNKVQDKAATMLQFIAQARTIAMRLLEDAKVVPALEAPVVLAQAHSPYTARAAVADSQSDAPDTGNEPVNMVRLVQNLSDPYQP